METHADAVTAETLRLAYQLEFLAIDAAISAVKKERYKIRARMHRERYRMEKSKAKASRMREAGLRLEFLRRKLQMRKQKVDAVPADARDTVTDADLENHQDITTKMTPKDYPAGKIMEEVFSRICSNWDLDTIWDALPGALNPDHATQIMEWGVDFIDKLDVLAKLTHGKHELVIKQLQTRILARRGAQDMRGEPWTIQEDLENLSNRFKPAPVGVLSQSEYRYRGKGVSYRVPNQDVRTAGGGVLQTAKKTGTIPPTSNSEASLSSPTGLHQPQIYTAGLNKRKEFPSSDESLEDIESGGLRKRFRASSAESESENVRAKTIIGDDQLMDEKNMTFEERYPLPDAPPARRMRMLKLLKQRNQGLRRPDVGHAYIDHEIDYRIELELHQEDTYAVQEEKNEY